MNGALLLTSMLAGRRILGTANPELLAWTSERWDSWLAGQRSGAPDPSKQRLIAVAEVTCVEDLKLHVGLMQLLADARFRCTVLLSAPTEQAASILAAQARREGWQYLVHIAKRSESRRLLNRLPPSAALAVFRQPCALTRDDIERLVPAGGPKQVGGEQRPAAFLGRAGKFSKWAALPEPDRLGWSSMLAELRGQCIRSLASEYSSAPAARRPWPKLVASQDAVRSDEGSVAIPAVEENDEIVVRTSSEPRESTVIARRYARLGRRGDALKIRAPGSLLTTTPQVLRLEGHKPDGSVQGTDLLFRVPPSRIEPWMISAFLNRGGGGNPMIRAFAAGIGCRMAYAEDEPETLSDIPVVWGVLRDSDRILAQAKAQSLYFFYIDHAYFNRGHGKSYRISRNRYEAGPVRDCPSDRIAQIGLEVRPWRTSGRDIIVCPPTDYFMQAHGCADWLDTTLERLEHFTDRPVVIREKPQPGETAVPLEAALESAHALVTHSSNVAIEAACLGTPVFVDPASAAAPIGRTDLSEIEDPYFPDREPWLAHLAYSQFSLDEIRDGSAWRLLLEMEERDFA